MTIYLDHILIAVPDMEAAVEQLGKSLGLVFAPPSYHTGSVTYNRMARFANGTSLELLGLVSHDQPAAIAGEEHDYHYFDAGPSQFGFALRTNDLSALVGRSREYGGTLSEPSYGEAKMTDGSVRAWMSSHVAGLEGDLFRVVPFVIQYTAGWGPDLWRTQGLLEHEIDYEGIAGVSLSVTEEVVDYLYTYNFWLMNTVVGYDGTPFYPTDEGSFIEPLPRPDEHSEGQAPDSTEIDTIYLAVPNLSEAAAKLRAWRVDFVEGQHEEDAVLRIDPQATLGLRFALMLGELCPTRLP